MVYEFYLNSATYVLMQYFRNLSITFKYIYGGARGVVVYAVGNERGDTSSNPGRDRLHCTNTLGKGMNPIIVPPAMGK